ncbi:hypothetical protein [Qipengyuania oceanensis]|nr:hypothetical protein [Qipengyuania oceanensis]
MTSFGSSEDVANQDILAFELIDVVGKQSRNTMGGDLTHRGFRS